MALTKLMNLFALSSLAVLICSVGVTPANALSVERDFVEISRRAHGHDAMAKRKRSTGKRSSSGRCKSKSSSAAAPPPTSAAAPAGNDAQKADPTSTKQKDPASTPPPKNTPAPPKSTFSGANGRKVGLSYTGGGNIQSFLSDHTHYTYNWAATFAQGVKGSGLTYMPMLWSDDQDKVNTFVNNVKAGYANIAMGFNEVNQGDQANMSPGQAVDAWLKYIQPLAGQGYKLVSPSTTSAPNGINWMQSFLQICNGRCTLDFMSLHFYGTKADDLIQYIEKWHDAFGIPIMVTEFACMDFIGGPQCNEGDVQNFYGDSIKWMEQQSYVEAYFAYGVLPAMNGVNELDSLMSNGKPSSLGSQYINVAW